MLVRRLAAFAAVVSALRRAPPLVARRRVRGLVGRRLVVRGAAAAAPSLNASSTAPVAEVLRAAGAPEAALSALPKTLGDDASVVRYLLDDAGFTAGDAAAMVAACPALAGGASAANARAAVEYLDGAFSLRRCDLRRVVRSEPEILLRPFGARQPVFDTGACPAVLAAASGGPAAGPRANAETRLADTVLLLKATGCRAKHVRDMVVRYPKLLGLEMAQMLAVTDFLTGLRFEGTLGSLYRSAPWLLAAPVAEMRAAAAALVDEVGVRRLEVVVRAYPRALVSSRDELLRPLATLRDVGGLDADQVAGVVESFPLVLGLEALEPTLAFLLDEADVAREDAPRVVRAFPSLLGVDVAQMRACAAFLRGAGVVNVGRFVTRLPPVLAYDVDLDLRPKLQHLVGAALSVYDVVRFPAYFSYPLRTVIAPRTAFVKSLGVPLTRFSLAALLTPSDRDFARKLLGVAPRVYAEFKADMLRPPEAGPRPAFPPRPSKDRAPGDAFPTFKAGPPPADPPPPPPRRRKRRPGPTATS